MDTDSPRMTADKLGAMYGQPVPDLFVLALLAGLALIWVLLGRPWRLLLRAEVQHAAFGSIVLLALFWGIRAQFPGVVQSAMAAGVPVQLIGASLLVVMFGLRPALLLLALVSLIATWLLSPSGSWDAGTFALAAAVRYAWLGVLPALVTAGVHAAIRNLLPRHLFVFIFGHGYFAALFGVFASGLTSAALARSASVGMPALSWSEVIAALLTLSFAEAFITGILVVIFVVYKPGWVQTFDDCDDLLRN